MIGIAAALFALQTVGRKALKDTSASWSLVESFGAVTFLHSVFFELLTDISRPLVLIGLLVGSLLSGNSARDAYSSLTTGIVLLVITVVGYGSVGYYVVGSEPGAPMMIWQLYGVVLAALFLLNGYRNSLAGGSSQSVYFLLGHSLTVATLYGICEPYGSVALSVAWSVYAITVLVIGFSAHNAALAKSSMVVLFFSVAKVFLYDVSNAAPLVRILCLLVTAGVLYGTGWVFRTIEGWKRN
jgi:hypothetical protein